MLRAIVVYWPLLVVIPVALVLGGGLYLYGDPWSAGDWASNIVFAYVVTIATVVLSRRQERLQEASAATELAEKIASVSGGLDSLKRGARADSVRRLLLDGRSGVYLLPFADDTSRAEYIATLLLAAGEVHELITGSVRPYTLWSDHDWRSTAQAASVLETTLEKHLPDGDAETPDARALHGHLSAIGRTGAQDGTVPFTNFEKSFRRGDVSQRIRARLDWDLLERHVADGEAEVRVVRTWSADWIDRFRLLSVWYSRTDHGTVDFASGDYDDPDVRPICLNTISDYFDGMPEVRKAGIESMSHIFETRPDGLLPTVEVVTLQLAPDALLLLDGNHRVAALMRGREHASTAALANIVEYRIVGQHPLGPALLPDLRHHATR